MDHTEMHLPGQSKTTASSRKIRKTRSSKIEKKINLNNNDIHAAGNVNIGNNITNNYNTINFSNFQECNILLAKIERKKNQLNLLFEHPILQKEIAEEIQELEQEFYALKKAIVNAYDHVFSVKMDSPELRKVKNALDDGDLETANFLLQEEKLKNLQTQFKEADELRKGAETNFRIKQQDLVNLYLAKAGLTPVFGAKNKFEESCYFFKEAIKTNPDFFISNFKFANFLNEHSENLEEAEIYYERALKAKEITEAERADTFFNMAKLYQKAGDDMEAEYHFNKSIKIGRVLQGSDENCAAIKLAKYLNAKGAYLEEKGKNYSEQETLYNEAIQLLKTLNEVQNLDSKILQSEIKNNLALFYMKQNNGFLKAISCFQKALNVSRNIEYGPLDRLKAQEREAVILSNIASCYLMLHKTLKKEQAENAPNKYMKLAEVYYEKSMGQFQQLAEENPIKYKQDLAKEQINLSIFYFSLGQKEMSKQYAEKGLQILKKYLKALPHLEASYQLGEKVLQKLAQTNQDK